MKSRLDEGTTAYEIRYMILLNIRTYKGLFETIR
jgi:hypothetical protein